MDAAARIKPNREAVRDEGRKAEVIANVRRLAPGAGVDPETAAALYEQLVEASIAHEHVEFDALRAGPSASAD
jgi:isochorismate pyruvate lyase